MKKTVLKYESMFSSDIEEEHYRISSGDWESIYIVGDVHGCSEELDKLLEKISLTQDDLIIFVGDLIRKGPDSRSVIEEVRDLKNAISVRGNNEEKLLRREATDPSLSSEHIEYIKSMPVVLSWEDNIVVHGGIDPYKSLKEHTLEDLQETRSLYGNGYEGTFWFEEYEGNNRIFFGHTVLDTPIETDNLVGLDTGCVYGGYLTAYDVFESEFIFVDAETEYRHRDKKHIVSTENFV